MTTTRRQRIALYGGTFDPVHVGHMTVARNLSESFVLDEVLFIPAHVAPHKRNAMVSPALHRHAMLALATQQDSRLRISTVELDAPEKPYTVDTLARFRSEMGAATRLFFIMGADSWEEITTWREWERVLSLTDQLIVTRPGYELTTGHVSEPIRERIVDVRGASNEDITRAVEAGDGAKIFLTDAATVDVSSTGVRCVVREREAADLSALVAPPVADYIKKYRLYREAHETESNHAGRDYARG